MGMQHLRQLESGFSISIPADEDGFIGRECPSPECLGYFQVEFGTGLKGEDLPCHCPYCGCTDGHDKFWTPEQLKYIESVALNKVTRALQQDFQKWDRDLRRCTRGGFIQLRVEYKGRPRPIRYYQEKELETEVICDICTLHYAIYGVFGYCPDCGVHNSRQILEKNLELAEKEQALAKSSKDDEEFAAYLVADALENAVSAFDGFGRETCRVHAAKASKPSQAENISFQNPARASDRLQSLFGFDLASSMSPEAWSYVFKCFQKRHLLAHKMGVVDEAYIKATGDTQAVVGRKVSIEADEVKAIIDHLKHLGEYLVAQLSTI